MSWVPLTAELFLDLRYLVDTTDKKKKFCIHDFHLKYHQGSNNPYSVCIKCGYKRKAILTEKDGIKFTLPASKRSTFKTFLDHFEEMQQAPNWASINFKGWELPGREEPTALCESYYTIGCTNLEGHKNHPHGKGKYYIDRKQRFCYRPRCSRCKLKWMYREGDVAAKRLEKYEKKSKKKAKHVIVSPPPWVLSQPLEKLRKYAIKILKEVKADGGIIIIHPFKTDHKTGYLYDSPHFHVVGFGWLECLADAYKKHGWKIIPKGPRDSTFATVVYQLSHAGIKKGKHTLVWFGELSYSELKVEKEQTKVVCPACGEELKEMCFFYVGKPPPPDVKFSMFVDPAGWSLVETKPRTEWTKQDRYEYALERELYSANKGV